MEDETTTKGATPEAPASAPDPVQAAKDLLAAQGLYVLEQPQFADIKGKAAKEAEQRAAALAADYGLLKAEHEKAAARLREIDDAGKTREQIWQERQQEWQRQQDALRTEAENAKAAHNESVSKYRQAMVDQRLGLLLKGSIDPELAILAARHRLPGSLGVDDQGRLTHEDAAGIVRVGPDAERVVDSWWQTQSALRTASVPAGPPTSGGRAAAGPAEMEPFNPPAGASMSEQLEYARNYQARKDALQGQNR